MKPFILAAIAAIILTLLVACTNPNPTTPELVAYNERIFQIWGMVIGSVVIPLATAVIAWLAKRDAQSAVQGVQKLSAKVDVQQEELLKKTDTQTAQVVSATQEAVEQAASMQPSDDGRRDRRSTDKPMLGG